MQRLPVLLGLGAAVALVPVPAMATSEPPVSSERGAADDFVIQISWEGGLIPMEFAFVNTPMLVLTDDGRLVTPGAIPEIYPGPLVPVLSQRSITAEGVQAYLDLAEEHGLFEHREYEDNPLIMDAGFAVVRIKVEGEEYVHSAYALGVEEETDPDRAELLDFFDQALDPVSLVGEGVLGEEVAFETDSYLVLAYESDPTLEAETEPAPEVVQWPAEASVRLGDATVCAEVPYDEVAGVLADATQLTWFEDDGVTYRVAATPRLPGRSC
jgi:hypothetical protein